MTKWREYVRGWWQDLNPIAALLIGLLGVSIAGVLLMVVGEAIAQNFLGWMR